MPLLGGPCRNITMTFGVEKLEWFGYRWWRKFEDMFIHFNKIHKGDRRTLLCIMAMIVKTDGMTVNTQDSE